MTLRRRLLLGTAALPVADPRFFWIYNICMFCLAYRGGPFLTIVKLLPIIPWRKGEKKRRLLTLGCVVYKGGRLNPIYGLHAPL